MIKIKANVMLILAMVLTIGSTVSVHAGLFDFFAKPLEAPGNYDKHNCEWEGYDLYVVWNKVQDADKYKVKINNKTYESNTNRIKVTPDSSQLTSGNVSGQIEVSAVPASNDNKHKASNFSTIKYSGTVLKKPEKYTYYWDGDCYKVIFSEVSGASYYELINSDTQKDWQLYSDSFTCNLTDADRQAGSIDYHFSIAAIPNEAEKSTRMSDYVNMTVQSLYLPDSSFVDDEYSAAFLSKAQLINYLRNMGYNPTEKNDNSGQYTIIDVSLKDSNNGGWKKIGNIAAGAAIGAIGNILDSSDAITEYGNEHGGDYGTAAKWVGGLGAAAGAFDEGFKDTNIHFRYYYEKGNEDGSAAFMQHSYMISGNPEPDISGYQYYDSDNKTYIYNNPWFCRYLNMGYEKQNDRWVVYAEPSGCTNVYRF